MGKHKFTLHKTVTNNFYFRLRTESGVLLLTSCNYPGLHKCLNEVYALQVYDGYILKGDFEACGQHGFCLKDPEGMIIAKSPSYLSPVRMNEDMGLIRASFRKEEIEDRCTNVRISRPAKVQR